MDSYGIVSILPPLIAIILCIVSKQLIISLFIGVFTGALILAGYNPAAAFAGTIQQCISSMASEWNAGIIMFTLLLGGFIGVLSKSGGTQGLVKLVIKKVNNGRRGQLSTILLSILLFFDDYTSIVLSGVVMRPLTDKLRISREKLSYIVDSAGAGVSATAPVSNWAAFELGVIAEVLVILGITQSAYLVFLQSIPYRFYCIFSVAFVIFIAVQRRDFGRMYKAEKRAITTGEVLREGSTPMAGISEEEFSPKEGTPMRARNFFIPLISVFVVAFTGFFITGGGTAALREGGLAQVMGNADVLGMLICGVVFATALCGIMLWVQKIMTVTEITDAWTTGMKAIIFTIAFIVLAWAVAGVCKELGTANFIVGLMVQANFPAWALPVSIFIIACLISFATGSSWGTMALVMPLALPAAQAIDANLIAALGAVLTGATFGDHCSPISESVVLSSMSAACDHMDHVMTQIPYALTAAGISMALGFIPAGFGVPVWLCLILGLAAAWLIIRFVGKRTDGAAFGINEEDLAAKADQVTVAGDAA